jgi:antitoxin ParD1/3/4
MNISLSRKMQQFVQQKLQEGEYDSPDEVIEAGLASLEQQQRHTDFAPGELERLLAQGEADIERGDVYDGEEVFRELDQLSAARRKEQAK